MNEILQKLLESELLTEDSKKELAEAFQSHLAEAVDAAKAAAEADVRVELHEQFNVEKERLIEAIDSKVNEFMVAEIDALKEDIKAFRDLEAEKLVEIAKEKKRLGGVLKEDMAKLIAKIDTFLEMRITEEFKELKADIKESKRNEFGKAVFEAFLPEYRKYFVDPTDSERELTEARIKIDNLTKKYKNVKKEKESLTRKVKLESILSPLSGASYDIMESILNSVATERLEEAYKLYLPRVLKENEQKSKAKPITESAGSKSNKEQVFDHSAFLTGDSNVDQTAQINESVESPSIIKDLTRLAGIA